MGTDLNAFLLLASLFLQYDIARLDDRFVQGPSSHLTLSHGS